VPQLDPSALTVIEFVEIVGKTPKTGKPSRRTHRLDWAVCDVCGEGIWSSRIAATAVYDRETGALLRGDPVPGMTCRMTPRCSGKHRKIEGAK
jgi:hypothetical protein